MSKLNALVVDFGGIYVETAVRFMRDCASVKYCTLAGEELSGKIGEGMDGIEVVSSPWNHVDDVDFIFFPDTCSGEMVEYLKKHGYPVAGAGAIEKIETDRWYGRQLQNKSGLPVQETIPITGVTTLKEFCKTHNDYFVKVDNGYRGLCESFKHVDFKTSEPRIDFIAYKTGPFKEKVFFMVEKVMEGVEPGFDGITFDGEILYPTAAGYEVGKKSHIVRVYKNEAELPDPYLWIHEGLAPEFKKNKTRFFYSDEMIIGKDKFPYLLDPTMRLASPGHGIQQELIENYTEVCYGLATGKKINPIIKHKYGMCSIMYTTEAEKEFINIRFPKEMRRWVKFINACRVGQDYYSIPPEIFVCAVVGLGNTVEETLNTVKERLKEVKGNGLISDDTGLAKLNEIISNGEKVEINF